jgi:predicted outer membrane protein
MKCARRFGPVAIAWCCWAAAVQAQAPDPSGSAAGRPRPTPPEFAAQAAASARQLAAPEREARRFLKGAWASSRFQVDAARIASRSTDPEIRSFAASSRTTHARARDELLGLLHRRGLASPMLENAQRRTLAHLARLKGAKLDAAYVQAIVAATAAELAQCERAASQVDDAALRRWIDRIVPVLREQLREAQRLAAGHHDAEPAQPARRPRNRHRGE